METAKPHIHVACYVRTASLAAPIDATIRTLDRLEADGAVDDVTVDAWPAEVRLGDDPPTDVVEVFEEFDAWAEQWNVSIRPPFAVETRTSEITGDTREVLVTPVRCLAVYVNGVLTEVFPHSTDRTGGETYTVADALTLLEEHDIRAFGADQSPDTPPSQRTAIAQTHPAADTCPACETRLVTGQGVYACPDCDWTGIATGRGQYRTVGQHTVPTPAPTEDEDEDGDEKSPAPDPHR